MPCGRFSVWILSIIVRISAIPALSSAPRIVVPSEVSSVRPFSPQFAVERALSPEEYPLIAAVTEQVKALSKNVGYDAEDALRVDPETGEVIEPLN